MMRWIDTHCHLDDDLFTDDVAAVVAQSVAAGFDWLVTIGITAASSEQCVRLAAHYDPVVAAVGIQPNYAGQAAPNDWHRIVGLADRPRVVAIGETGLDRHWDFTPFGIQQDFFARHLELARQRDLPFIVHMRDCDADVMTMLRDARRRGILRGVMHAFSGSAETAAECLELGLYISFAGMVTFPKATSLREIAASVPSDRLLIETDAPYLSPHPKRGQRRNEPALLIHTADCLAKRRGVQLDELARQTTANASALFRLPGRHAEA